MCDIAEGLPLNEDERRSLREIQGGEEISTDFARFQLIEALRDAFTSAENTLISAPTGLGKTYLAATTQWTDYPEDTNNQPVIHIHKTTDARNEAAEKSDAAGLNYKILQSREEACPVAAGDYDTEYTAPDGRSPSEWFNLKCDVEKIRFSQAHGFLEEYLHGLPCTSDGSCESQAQWQNVPRNDAGQPEYDIIHATAPFAKIPDLIDNANVIFDEQPDYRLQIDQEYLRRAMNDLLARRADEAGYTWEELIEIAKMDIATRYSGTLPPEDPDASERASEYSELLHNDVDETIQFDTEEPVITLAPAIGRAILNAMEIGNDRYWGSNSGISVVFDEQNTLRVILAPPDLSQARCVVGLDAHPSENLWRMHTGITFTHGEVLTPEQRLYWRTTERGLYVVQIGRNTNPLTRGWRNNRQEAEARAIIRELRRKAGEAFHTAIAPQSLEDDIEAMMRDVGIENPELLHYGEERSLNRFEGERVGLLLGCIDPGDDYVLDMLAVRGQDAEPEMEEGESGELRRAYGREFVGPDADAAEEYLRSVREHHVAQSIGRYARSPLESDESAIVYVWTDAIPEGMVDMQVPGLVSEITEERDLTETKEAIDRYVREADEPVTKRDVAEAVDVSNRYAWEVLTDMEHQEVVRRSEGTGPNGADEYEYVSGSLGPTVDLSLQ